MHSVKRSKSVFTSPGSKPRIADIWSDHASPGTRRPRSSCPHRRSAGRAPERLAFVRASAVEPATSSRCATRWTKTVHSIGRTTTSAAPARYAAATALPSPASTTTTIGTASSRRSRSSSPHREKPSASMRSKARSTRSGRSAAEGREHLGFGGGSRHFEARALEGVNAPRARWRRRRPRPESWRGGARTHFSPLDRISVGSSDL